MSNSAKEFFTPADQESIRKAIADAELDTSGEIRVHIESQCRGEVLDCAAYLFEKLGMKKTEQRNGVLIFLAIQDKKFAILGDSGINAVVPANFWDEIKESMGISFRQGKFTEGLVNAIRSAGQQLKQHFPYQLNDINELSNDISFGN